MTIKPKYPVLLHPLSSEDGDGWIAIVPDLPGCISDGSTPLEALQNVQDAIETWIAASKETHISVPQPEDFRHRNFVDTVSPELRREAEMIARQMHHGHDPDPALLSAVYQEVARQALTRAGL
jgi:antitoxin HicB